jgi:hypothetical protein
MNEWKISCKTVTMQMHVSTFLPIPYHSQDIADTIFEQQSNFFLTKKCSFNRIIINRDNDYGDKLFVNSRVVPVLSSWRELQMSKTPSTSMNIFQKVINRPILKLRR